MILHTIQPGDTVYTIARRYGVDPAQVLNDNDIDRPEYLIPGQTLLLPVAYWEYRVSPGQSLYQIAGSFNTDVPALLRINPEIQNPAMIDEYSDIRIPAQNVEKPYIEVNGYCYPGVNMEILEATLPFLTYLSIFSYAVNPDGSLRPIEDAPLIAAAKAQGVAPMMVITNLAEEGGFNSETASSILTSPEAQNTLLANVEAVLSEKGYYGLDIDFEYVFEGERTLYNSFLEKTANRLRPLGYHLSSAVAPKLTAGQQGRLYTAHDYRAHGEFMDRVIIMTYEWGYLYGPPMAVAPVGPVERVIEYAVTEIPPEKILMGMPNYGYDWTLPYVEGSRADPISNREALEIARERGANIQFDEASQAPFFQYFDDEGREHVVWFEDAKSDVARLRLVDQYGLAGVSYWTIDNFFLPNWLALTSLYSITKLV